MPIGVARAHRHRLGQVVAALVVEVVVGHVEQRLLGRGARVEDELHPDAQEVHVRRQLDDVPRGPDGPGAAWRCRRSAGRTGCGRRWSRGRRPGTSWEAPNRWPTLASSAERLHMGPGGPGRARDVRRGGGQVEAQRAERGGGGHRGEGELGPDRLVTRQEVVVLLDDDQAPGRHRGARCRPAPSRRCGPGPQAVSHGVPPVRDRPEVRSGEAGLAEAGPALAAVVLRLGLRHQGRRHRVGDLVVDLGAVRLEVDRGDEGVLVQVRVEQGAVVVVGAAGRR